MARQDDVILIVRHPWLARDHFDLVLDWVRDQAPALSPLFLVRDLPVTLEPEWNVRLLVTWLQDPVEFRTPDTFVFAEKLSDYFTARGVPTINRAAILSNGIKSRAAPLIASAGLRVPRIARIDDAPSFRADFGGLALPFFVREDHIHGSPMLLAKTRDEARALPIESFTLPIAVEYIETASPADGLYRKFRYFACRETGVSQHLQVTKEWIARGEGRIFTPQTQAEEMEYISRFDRNHDRFQAALKALGFDMAAFDYAYDASGEVVVWEVNPFPRIVFGKSTSMYRDRAIHASIAAMVQMYLDAAGLVVPDAISRHLRL